MLYTDCVPTVWPILTENPFNVKLNELREAQRVSEHCRGDRARNVSQAKFTAC